MLLELFKQHQIIALDCSYLYHSILIISLFFNILRMFKLHKKNHSTTFLASLNGLEAAGNLIT